MHFETPPNVSLVWAALRREHPDDGLPRLVATASRVPLDARAYALVCGLPGADPVPLCWPDIAARGLQLSVLMDPRFPFRLLGAVHVRQRIERLRLLRADEELEGRVTVEGFTVVRQGAEFDVTTELSARGEVVWRGVSTILSRAVPGDGLKRTAPPLPVPRAEHTAQWPLGADLGRRYAKVSGDYNPIHLWPLTARPFGFRQPIIHGWWSLARCLGELGDQVPAACVVEVFFRRPVPLPSTVDFVGGPLEGGPGLAFTLSRQGEVALVGTVRAR
jgi:hypothetical protein